MNIRQPVVAGAFYEAPPSSCRHHVEKLLAAAELPGDLPSPLYAGLVPHAGWVYSGAVAAKTLKALLAGRDRHTVVLFGADHTGIVQQGEVYESGLWRTPLGDVAIDEALAKEVLACDSRLRANPRAHAREHSLEVQVPIVQVLAPAARILPIAVPPGDAAAPIGAAIGKVLAGKGQAVCIVGSTDLTHHGGGRFPAPGGRGPAGERWTCQNDRRMLDLVEAMDAEAIVPEAEAHMNACGAGAIAATVAAAKAMGATRGITLEYTNSYQVVHKQYPHELDDTTVGYAAVVFG